MHTYVWLYIVFFEKMQDTVYVNCIDYNFPIVSPKLHFLSDLQNFSHQHEGLGNCVGFLSEF